MFRIICCIVLYLAGVVFSFGQNLVNGEWSRFESPTKDFSFALPANGYLIDNEDGEYRVYYVAGQSLFSVVVEKNSDAKSQFRRGLQFIRDRDRYKFFEVGDFLIRQYNPEPKKDSFYTWLYLASSNGSITISASSEDRSSNLLQRFLASISLDGKSLFSAATPFPSEGRTISLDSLKTDNAVLTALHQADSGQERLESVKTELDQVPVDLSNQTAGTDKKYSRPLIVLRRPRASYTGSARERGLNGSVRLRVTFSPTGQIGPISLISKVDSGLARNALRAARKIKFLPAEINGEPAEVSKIVEYTFTTY